MSKNIIKAENKIKIEGNKKRKSRREGQSKKRVQKKKRGPEKDRELEKVVGEGPRIRESGQGLKREGKWEERWWKRRMIRERRGRD